MKPKTRAALFLLASVVAGVFAPNRAIAQKMPVSEPMAQERTLFRNQNGSLNVRAIDSALTHKLTATGIETAPFFARGFNPNFSGANLDTYLSPKQFPGIIDAPIPVSYKLSAPSSSDIRFTQIFYIPSHKDLSSKRFLSAMASDTAIPVANRMAATLALSGRARIIDDATVEGNCELGLLAPYYSLFPLNAKVEGEDLGVLQFRYGSAFPTDSALFTKRNVFIVASNDSTSATTHETTTTITLSAYVGGKLAVQPHTLWTEGEDVPRNSRYDPGNAAVEEDSTITAKFSSRAMTLTSDIVDSNIGLFAFSQKRGTVKKIGQFKSDRNEEGTQSCEISISLLKTLPPNAQLVMVFLGGGLSVGTAGGILSERKLTLEQ